MNSALKVLAAALAVLLLATTSDAHPFGGRGGRGHRQGHRHRGGPGHGGGGGPTVPEPASVGLLAAGGLALAGLRKLRRRR